ncbi:MAG TPA: helix-turn-helix transcriptional regulator [Vicinamibacterales bacterium]|nr:helix-turn-helix transcriptional regulator [Vicinamibacterales bacterium]
MKRKRAYLTLADYLESEGVDQRTLAKKAGTTQPNISMIKNRQRSASLGLALKLSRIANVPVESLLHVKDAV